MAEQTTIFGEAAKMHVSAPEKTRVSSGEESSQSSFESEEYCIREIETEEYLWDMRCWEKYHDREEVLEYLRTGNRVLNCGHVEYCIDVLKMMGISLEKIADAMLRNNGIEYKNRIVRCFHDGSLCPKYRQQGHYGGDICAGCE